MSVPSKRRRQARKAIRREAERLAATARREAGEARSLAAWERGRAGRLASLIAARDGAVMPQGAPQYPVYMFHQPPAIESRYFMRGDLDRRAVPLTRSQIRAVPYSLRVVNVDVCWWAWEAVG